MCGQCDASDDLMEPYDEWRLEGLVTLLMNRYAVFAKAVLDQKDN